MVFKDIAKIHCLLVIFSIHKERPKCQAERMGHWDIENKEFVISFFSDNFLGYSTYGKIIRSIKKNWSILKFMKITEENGLYICMKKRGHFRLSEKDGWLMVLGITSNIV